MKKYFIYFSATGNGDYLSSLLEKEGYFPIKIEMEKPIGKIGFFKILRYGGRAISEKTEKLKPFDLHIEKGDDVIIGSPIWNDRLSTPIITILKQYDFDKSHTRFILYPAGQTTTKSLKQLIKFGFINEPIVVPYPLKYKPEKINL